MEYFGRNLFVMNILPISTSLKYLITGHLRAGNRGDPWQTDVNRSAKPAQCGGDGAKKGGGGERGMVRPEGVEPPTYWFVASCSIQLSYGRTLRGMQPSKNTGIRRPEQTSEA